MKKLIYCVAALATVFFAGSCQRENFEPVGNGAVTFTVTAPGDLDTRAIADGTNVNEVHWAVYKNVEGVVNSLYTSTEKPLAQGIVPMENKAATLELDLLQDQDYTILFWAQVAGKDYYTVGDLREVTINATTVAANDESRAAFFKRHDFNTSTQQNYDVTLVRPFAQINLGTTLASLSPVQEGQTQGYTINVQKSQMVVKGIASSFSLVTGEGKNEAVDFTFTSTATPAKADPVEKLFVNDVEYHYVGMNYLVIPIEDKTVTVSYEITTDKGNITNTINNVPVKENYRTNIIGNLLTSKTDFEIVVDERFVADNNITPISVSTPEGLQDAIDNIEAGATGTIKLEGDINLSDLFASLTKTTAEEPKNISIATGLSATIDLNGYSITGVDEGTASFGLITNRGNLTITNSSSKQSRIALVAKENREWNAYSSVISNTVGGNLLVKGDVLIEHLGGTDMAYGIDNLTNGKGTSAVTTVEGATVKSTYRAIRQFLNGVEATNELYVKAGSKIYGPDNKSIWMQDPSKDANTGKLVVEEGAELYGDVYLTVTAGSTEWPVEVSIADSALQGESTVLTSNVPVGYEVKNENGTWIVKSNYVAKIGETEYRTLAAAVAAVEDGGIITLVANEKFTEANRYNNGGWWDGLGYSGDKSFTIDLGGYTISQDGSLNDYLIWIKNDGEKANTITFKNGTMDAGTTAYSALATSSSNAQTMTVNLENINLINNISNGAVVKARGGSVLNVKAGTVITGKDSYVGIEAVGNNTVVNVYDGVEIYQNGTTNYVGAIIGASYNATLNIYGGKGKSAKCGIIVMSTGATINVSGGEWTANGDGTVAGDNQAVLVSQNNRYESGWACKSILNVTGGTFKGGFNCYGMGPGVEADDAQINIKGGNFNADPKAYVVNGYKSVENNGTWNIAVDPVAKIGTTEYATLQEAFEVGGNITLLRDVTITEPATLSGKTAVLDLNGKTLTADKVSALVSTEGSELTVKNGKVVAYESTVRAVGGKLVVESGEYTSTGTALDSPSTYRYSLDCREDGELVINGGTFKSNNGMINVSSTVTVNGGKFENIVEKTMTRHFAYVSAPLTINDGEFYGKANGAAGGCFFCGAASGCDIQINGGKFTSLWVSGSVNGIFEVYYGGTINVTGGMFNTNRGIANFVVENTDEATKDAYPYIAK